VNGGADLIHRRTERDGEALARFCPEEAFSAAYVAARYEARLGQMARELSAARERRRAPAVDGEGRFHFFAQLRFPQGIYHGYWDQEQWTLPSMIYLIRSNSDDEIGSRVHAHYTLGVVRLGNQIVLTFTDPPPDSKRRLFVMHRTLDDVGMIAPWPTPSPIPTQIPEATPTPVPTDVPSTVSFNAEATPVSQIPSPASSIWSGLIVTLVLLVGTVVYSVFFKNGRRE